jgi:hypothetical protein
MSFNRKSIIAPYQGSGLSTDVLEKPRLDSNVGRKFGQYLGSNGEWLLLF